MKTMVKVVNYIFNNRRIIGLLVGGSLTLAGFPEVGDYVTKVGGI